MARPHGNMPPVRRPKNAGKTLLRVVGYAGKLRIQLILVAIGLIISSGANVAGTYFLKPVINRYLVPFIGQEQVDLSGFIRILLVMAGVYLAGVIASYGYNRLMLNIATRSLKKIRTDLFSAMQQLPIRFFDTHTHGELMSRFTNDTDTLREMLGNGIPHFISSFLSVSGVFIMMLVLSPALTVLVLFMLAIMLFVVKTVGGKSGLYFKKQQQELGRMNGYIEEMIEGQKVVKIFSREKRVNEDFDALNESLCEAATNANSFANVLMPIMGNLSYLHYALTAVVGGIMAVMGVSDIGTLGAFLQYTRSFSQPITQISQQFNSILSALAGAERIFALLDEPKEEDHGTVTLVRACRGEDGTLSESENGPLWAWKQPTDEGYRYIEVLGDVRLENVTFGYEENKIVLRDVSLYAKPGQKIAFVGSTGAGKTTITNLINRFYDIAEGSITYDGIPITDIKKPDLRRSLSMVLQDAHLFTGTVRDNIRYGRLDATDEEVEEAARLANAHSFIRHLPQGYDTVLTADGGNLSQGQRQLLSIARAAVADPPVLILDEATSSIDTRTEALIEKGMDKLMAGRTVFVIAHRLSTVRNSNAIMVLEHGKIIERGDHDSLVADKGKYYQLYTGSFDMDLD
ncbi:MAG: ABC transporter ATP-binding protein [Ruminococcaceae bacterium]|nr:ABC transporter ATP-binding protein [Oscillospiraceae bacterium]